jgi:hypothetical protein
VTTLLLRTLRQLRDPRAEGFLRGVIKRATAPVQAEAALALLAIGVEETQELAAHWLAQKELSAELLWASTHIQFHYGLPTRKAALLRLIEQAPDLALDVASAYTDVDLLVLGDHLSKLQHLTQRKQALTHLSRLEESAVPILKKTLLTTPELGVTAATLLARNPTATAATTLRELVAKRVPSDAPRHSALGLMALTVSALRGNADRAATLTLLERRLPHASGDELYAVKLGLAALDVEWALKCLASSAVQDASIAANVLGLHGVPYRTRVLQRLGEFAATPFAPLALALSAALSALGPQDPFPQVLLSAWAESSLPVAYAAVWQLCTRLPVTSDARLAQWLTHPDSEIRAAAYLGLGANPEPAHTATLLAKLHDEVDSWGRRVLLAALAKRPAIPPVQRALQREKTYYPDPGIELLFSPSKASAGLDFWFEPEPQTEAVGATMKATTPTPEPSTATTWLTLTSTVYPPFSVMVTQDMPMLMFLPDQRSLDADLFRAHTFPAPTTTQASN